MKRARPAPALFGEDSDSSSQPSPARRDRIPKHATKPATTAVSPPSRPLQQESRPERDSLDVFMSTLAAPPQRRQLPRAPPAAPDLSSDSSGDDRRALARAPAPDVREIVDEEKAAGREGHLARDLVLQPVDHARRTYAPIARSGYAPRPHLAGLSRTERGRKLQAMCASVRDADDVVPVDSFEDLADAMPEPLLAAVLADFEKPTPVQRVAVPAALHGQSVIGVAKTGSGKTAAYTIPLLCHIRAQPAGTSSSGRGPTGVVVAPTRELAMQISGIVRRFGEEIQVGVMCVVGGHAKYEQFKKLRDGGAEVVVCTPGRFIDMIKMKACSLSRCSFVVLDEADRMLDMGFGPQVDALLSQIRPDAQKLLFSATFPRSVASLARRYVFEPCRIIIGQAFGEEEGEMSCDGIRSRKVSAREVPMVSGNVTETYVVAETEAAKEAWLLEHLDDLIREGLVILFCHSRGASAAVANVVRKAGKPAACVHGETEAADREGLLRMFRSGEIPVLVTTDLSARGLDIANVASVVNVGSAKNWEWHVHRVGRTGRAEQRGSAYTILCRSSRVDMAFVDDAVSAFKSARLQVPQVLWDIWKAEQSARRDVRPYSKGYRGRRRMR